MPNINPLVMSNFLVSSDSIFLSVKLELRKREISTLTSYARNKSLGFSAALHLEGESLGSLKWSLRTFSCRVIMHQEPHCEKGPKHIRERFSQVLETTDA